MAIASFGATIHMAAVVGGPPWYAFFGAPPFIVESARAGTWPAPVSAMVIAGLMALCAAYAASALGLIRRLPLLLSALACSAAVCLVRALVLIPLAVKHPVLLNTFEVVAATVWGLAGLGFAAGFWASRRHPASLLDASVRSFMAKSKHPAVVTVSRAHAPLVRQVALEQHLTYEEASVPGEDGLARFHFGLLDDEASYRLVSAIPREAWAYHAVIAAP
jgi:hypothetical protein